MVLPSQISGLAAEACSQFGEEVHLATQVQNVKACLKTKHDIIHNTFFPEILVGDVQIQYCADNSSRRGPVSGGK